MFSKDQKARPNHWSLVWFSEKVWPFGLWSRPKAKETFGLEDQKTMVATGRGQIKRIHLIPILYNDLNF